MREINEGGEKAEGREDKWMEEGGQRGRGRYGGWGGRDGEIEGEREGGRERVNQGKFVLHVFLSKWLLSHQNLYHLAIYRNGFESRE